MKKAFAALCAVLSLFLTGLPIAAAETPTEPTEIVIHLDETGQTAIAPRFKYLSLIFTDLEITDGRAVCMANFSTASSRRVLSKSLTVSSGWYYRVQTVARVLDDSGATLEQVKLYSVVRQY